jgi:hypothetical protein
LVQIIRILSKSDNIRENDAKNLPEHLATHGIATTDVVLQIATSRSRSGTRLHHVPRR